MTTSYGAQGLGLGKEGFFLGYSRQVEEPTRRNDYRQMASRVPSPDSLPGLYEVMAMNSGWSC